MKQLPEGLKKTTPVMKSHLHCDTSFARTFKCNWLKKIVLAFGHH